MLKREVCKFFSGALAGLAYAHAVYAVMTSAGMIEEPVFRGRRWGVGYMWTETVVYSAISLAFGYFGWSAKPQKPHNPTSPAMDRSAAQLVGSDEPARTVS